MCVISEERVYLVMFFCIVCLIWILFKKSSKFWKSPFSSRNYNIGLAWQKWPINVLTILTGKNFFYSVQYKLCCLADFDLFYMFTQSIKFYTSIATYERIQMFEKGDPSNR